MMAPPEVRRVLRRWFDGDLTRCEHLTGKVLVPRDVVVVFAAAWAPDVLTCFDCWAMVFPEQGSDDDRRCDECGHVGDDIHIDEVIYGPLLWAIGRCDDCQARAMQAVAA